MPPKNQDLHGSAPDTSSIALLLIDVINDLDFPEADQLLPHALPMARQIASLKRRAKKEKIPVIYVNDNFGRWRSDFNAQVEHCLRDGVRGKPIAELLRPDKDDYLAGIAANICVLFTANDAYMRDFHLVVPGDCVASNTPDENNYA